MSERYELACDVTATVVGGGEHWERFVSRLQSAALPIWIGEMSSSPKTLRNLLAPRKCPYGVWLDTPCRAEIANGRSVAVSFYVEPYSHGLLFVPIYFDIPTSDSETSAIAHSWMAIVLCDSEIADELSSEIPELTSFPLRMNLAGYLKQSNPKSQVHRNNLAGKIVRRFGLVGNPYLPEFVDAIRMSHGDDRLENGKALIEDYAKIEKAFDFALFLASHQFGPDVISLPIGGQQFKPNFESLKKG